MNVTYHLQDKEFEWDDDKANSNLQKHGVSFEEAAEVFFDPFFQTGDATVDEDEEREFIVGYTFNQRLLLTVYTERGNRTRIISARSTTRAERELYEEA